MHRNKLQTNYKKKLNYGQLMFFVTKLGILDELYNLEGFTRVANYCSEVLPFPENHSILDH